MAEFISVRIKGLDELLRIASANLGPVMRTILTEVAELVKKEITHEPGPVHYPIQWVSDKQRRAYFAKRRLPGPAMKGMSRFMQLGPWQRETDVQSEKLLASWRIKAESDYRVMLSNPVSYGPWVQSEENQQPFHANTGWRTDEAAVQLVAMSRDVEGIVDREIGKLLEGTR